MSDDKPDLRIAYIPGKTPLSSYLKTLAGLRDIAIEQGSKLELGGNTAYTLEETLEDPNDPLAGTEFANTKPTIVPSEKTHMLERKEVYDCIDNCVILEKQEELYEAFETRFPEEKWGEQIPGSSVLQIFVNEHLDDLVRKKG